MDCQAAEVTDDETDVITSKTPQQSLNKEMEGIKSVMSTEEEDNFDKIILRTLKKFLSKKKVIIGASVAFKDKILRSYFLLDRTIAWLRLRFP